MKRFFSTHFLLVCTLIVAFAFFLRLSRLSTPKDFYFDEVYHAFTATTFLHNDPKGYEYWQTPPKGVAYEWTHPPLAKLMMAGGMALFGENSFGWRVSSVVTGTGVVAMVGFISYELFRRKKITVLALFFATIDGLLFSMSRIAMNDMHFLFFGLVSVYFYIRLRRTLFDQKSQKQSFGNAILTALFLGLALASKWTGLYLGAALATDLVLAIIVIGKFPLYRILPMALLALFLIPSIYLSSYTQFFLEGHTLTQWKETTQQMWWYHTGLKATHPYQSRPLQWITDTRPVWMSVDYSQNDTGLVGNIYNTGNPILFWTGLVTVIILTLRALRVGATRLNAFLFETKIRQTDMFPWALWFPLFLYGFLWIPWQFSPRIMFFYHYAPAVPFLCILTAYGLVWMQEHSRRFRLPMIVILSAITISWIALYPLNSGYPMPSSYFDTVFSIFPSWK